MTGLVWKDFLVLRKTLRVYVLMLAFYVGMTVLGVFQISFVTAMVNVIIMMLPIGAFSYDEMAKWDGYAAALPLRRSQIVGARYLFTLLLLLCSVAATLAATIILSITRPDELWESVVSLLTSGGAALFVVDIILPLSYKLGPERARPYLYAVVFLPILAMLGAYKLGVHVDLSWLDALPGASAAALFGVIPLAALAGMAVSFLISCRILKQKEF